MNRSEPVRQVAGETGLDPAAADAAVKAVLGAVAGALARGRFAWPAALGGAVSISAAQLGYLRGSIGGTRFGPAAFSCGLIRGEATHPARLL